MDGVGERDVLVKDSDEVGRGREIRVELSGTELEAAGAMDALPCVCVAGLITILEEELSERIDAIGLGELERSKDASDPCKRKRLFGRSQQSPLGVLEQQNSLLLSHSVR